MTCVSTVEICVKTPHDDRKIKKKINSVVFVKFQRNKNVITCQNTLFIYEKNGHYNRREIKEYS